MLPTIRLVRLQYFVCRNLLGDPAMSAINQGGCAVSSDDCVRYEQKSEDDSAVSIRKLMLVLTLMLVFHLDVTGSDKKLLLNYCSCQSVCYKLAISPQAVWTIVATWHILVFECRS